MSLFLETLRIRNGEIRNLSYHERRMCHTMIANYGCENSSSLGNVISEAASGLAPDTVYKCRVLYDRAITEVNFEAYKIKHHHCIITVEANDLDYSFKYANREVFSKLLECNPDYSDVLIIKNGFVTDTTYANIVLFRDGKIFTPSTPLLKGTMRQSLVEKGFITETEIRHKNLWEYDEFALVNAMIDLGEAPRYEIGIISDGHSKD